MPVKLKDLSGLPYTQKVVIFVIGGQVSISLIFIAFFAVVLVGGLETFNHIPKILTALMVMLSGPINLLTISTFPVFAVLSTFVCALLAAGAIKWSSELLALFFLLAWYITGLSGLVYAA